MEEVLESAHQSADHVEKPIETPVTTPVEASASPATTPEAQEPQGIRVKFNKEDRVIGLDEAPAWIQKGLNYDKVQEKVKEYEGQVKHLERTAKFNGFDTVDAYVQALDEAEHQRDIQAEAERLGVDESVVLEHLKPLRDKVEQLSQKEQEYDQLKSQLELQQEIVTLREKYKDFDQYGEKIVEIVTDKGYSLEDAYKLASLDDKLSRLEKETEAKTIRGLQDNASTTPGALGAEGPDETSGYMSMTPAQRREIRERVKRGEQVNI